MSSVFDPQAVETRGEHGGAALPRNVYSTALEAAKLVKSGAGKLYGFTVYNNKGSTQFVLLFDLATIPGNGIVPVMAYPVATVSTLAIRFGDTGRTFDGGCVLANSSTAASLTAGSADCWFDAQYV